MLFRSLGHVEPVHDARQRVLHRRHALLPARRRVLHPLQLRVDLEGGVQARVPSGDMLMPCVLVLSISEYESTLLSMSVADTDAAMLVSSSVERESGSACGASLTAATCK